MCKSASAQINTVNFEVSVFNLRLKVNDENDPVWVNCKLGNVYVKMLVDTGALICAISNLA